MNEDKILNKLEEHSKQIDTIATAVVELRVDVDEIKEAMLTTLATKKDLEAIVTTQDEMLVILKRIDQERLVAHKRVTDLEDKVEENTNDIKQVKVQLKMA